MKTKKLFKMVQQGRTLTVQYKGIILAFSTIPYQTTSCYGISDQLADELRKKDIPIDTLRDFYHCLDTLYAKQLVDDHVKGVQDVRKAEGKEKEREVKRKEQKSVLGERKQDEKQDPQNSTSLEKTTR